MYIVECSTYGCEMFKNNKMYSLFVFHFFLRKLVINTRLNKRKIGSVLSPVYLMCYEACFLTSSFYKANKEK